MKKKFFQILGCSFMAAFLMTACNSEESLVKDEIQGEKGKLSFILPLGGKKTVTYATGTDAEYEIERLMIFWFKDGASSSAATDVLYKRFGYGVNTANFNSITLSNTTLTATGNTTVATIDVGEDNFPSKFYIVANVNGSSVLSAAMLNVIPGTTTRAQFEQLLADAQADDAANAGDIIPLATPLPMSIHDDAASNTIGGFIEMSDLTGQLPTAHLKRRVAKFDVINTASYSNFTVKKIYVSRALKTGWLHDKDLAGTEPWADQTVPANTGKFAVADDGATYNFNGTPASDMSSTDGDLIPDIYQSGGVDSVEVSGPAFYLWPTELDDYPYTKTEIVIEGSYGTEDRLYRLDLSAGGVKIEANKVYHIRIVRAEANKLLFPLLVMDWDSEKEIFANGKDKTATFSAFTSNDSPAQTLNAGDTYTYAGTAAAPATLTFSVTGTATDAVSVVGGTAHISFTATGANFLDSDLAALQDPAIIQVSTSVTYASTYTSTYTVTLPPSTAPIDAVMKIANAGNTDELVTLNLKSLNYAKTGYAPVTLTYTDGGGDSHTLLWAPVNVGATNLPATKAKFSNDANGMAITGNYYQWGRNVPFASFGTINSVSTQFADIAAANASSDFYKGSGEWLSGTVDNGLWSGSGAQGPCPEGWRVPTKEEWDALIAKSTRTQDVGSAYTSYKITGGAATDVVYIPFGGNLISSSAAVTLYCNASGATGLIWTSTVGASNVPYRAACNTVGVSTSENKSSGLQVRAVREITVP